MAKLFNKLLAILLINIIILTGCSGSRNSYSYSLPMKNLNFGLTNDEIIDVLNLSNANLIKTDMAHSKYLKIEKQQVLNEEGTIIFSFFDYETGMLKDKLYSIAIEFNDVDIKVLLSTLENTYGDYIFYSNDNTKFYIWQKEALSSLTDEMIEKMKIIESSGYTDLSEEQLQYIDLAYESALNTPLSSIRFISRANPTDNLPKYSLVIEGKYSLLADLSMQY